jgi:hypothetical protein
MKKILIILCCVFALNFSLFSQKDELITVKAGTKILDCFPLSERYLYPEFISGRIVLKNDIYTERRFNYNYLLGEMEFIQVRDTLSIINKRDIKHISVAQDTFYYDKGYIKLLRGGALKLGMKEFIELKEIQNKDPYGVSSSAAATTSYGSMPLDGNFYKLTANKDMIFQRKKQFYLALPGGDFILLNRKNLMGIFPSEEDEIKSYLKANKVKFDLKDDILKLTDFLKTFNY